jgi:PIN domain nuclease of toxin-antitoxin system
MKLLLDTHVFLWLDGDAAGFPATVRAACESADNAVYLSVASVWEMQIKLMLGKLKTRIPLQRMVEDYLSDKALAVLPIQLEHVWHLGELPRLHGDPFDRMLVAQARSEGMTLVTADAAIHQYPVDVLWA